MKQIYLTLSLLLALIMSGCSSNSDSGSGGVVGPGGGGNANISFAISGTGDQTSYTFSVRPSVDTKISKVIVAVPSANFADTITTDPNQVFSGGTSYTLDPYTGVTQGLAFTFTFNGTIVSNNQSYTVTSNYTIP